MADSAAAAKEQPKRRHWPWIIIGLVVLLVALAAIAYGVVTSPPFIKGVVLPRVGDALHANVTVSNVSFSPFRQIVLENLKVQTRGQTPVLTMPSVSVRYHLWDILRGNFRVDDVTLDSPTIEVIENPDGTRNVDPLLKSLQQKPAKTAPEKPKPSQVPQVDLGKLILRNARLVQIRNYGDGQSNVLELTNLNFTLSNLKNGQSATAQLSAALWVNNNPPNGTNGFLAATLNGKFNVAMTPALTPASASGAAQFNVSSAYGLFENFSKFNAGLGCDATSTNIRQFDLHFEKSGASLGELTASGPLDLTKMEGSLQVVLSGIDRRLLNLAGTAAGLDFGSTTINSTNEITMGNSGKTIAATGRLFMDEFQVARAGQTTPKLNLDADYAVTVDNRSQTALLTQLTLQGTQEGRPLLAAQLSQPMTLAFGGATNSVGNSVFDLEVTNLDLSNWRPFMGNTVSGGHVNLQMKVSSQQAGRQLGFNLNSQIDDLVARMDSNQTFRASIGLQAQGQVMDFKQLNLGKYRLEITRQGQALLTASGSGTYDGATTNADIQLALDASLARLVDAFPQPDTKISSGALKLSGRVTQKDGAQTVLGRLTLTDLTGQVGKNSFNNFGSSMDVDIGRTPEQIRIKKLDGALTQNGNAGGNFAVTGVYGTADRKVNLNATLSEFNQNGLRPFLEPLLADKQLVSVMINGSASVQFVPDTSSAIKADLQVTNLVVRDPAGQLPATPLAAGLQIDTTLQKQSADIRQFELALTPADRAPNKVQLDGQVDFSQPKAIQGRLRLTSDGLDVTRYYDLFAGGKKTSGQTAPAVSAPPGSVPANQEPQPVNLPLKNFVLVADIAKLYLDEVAVTNFQTTVKVDGGHVTVKPFRLALNGAPVNGSADLNLSVPGYKYNLVLDGRQVPFAPLVDTFAPDRKGELGGTLTAHAQISGAGITGANLKKNLAGQFEVDATNLNLSVINIRSQVLKTLINVVATIPQLISSPETAVVSLLTRVTGLSKGGLMNQLQQSPIETIAVQGGAGDGKINLQSAMVQSAAFEADASGVIELAPVLTNSAINIPITVSLSHSIASQLNLVAANNATGAYVPLPEFLKMTRTLGDPKPEINKLALAGLTVQSLGNSLLKPSNGQQSPAGNLLNQILRQVK